MLRENMSTTLDEEYILKHGDPRMNDWPMMSSPLPTVLVCSAWLLFVKVLGPAVMRLREPFSLATIMVPYNFAMTAINAVGCFGLLRLTFLGKYSWRCEPIDFSDDPTARKVAGLLWYLFLSRFLELIDTVFFVLRKKQSQVSLLHVIHHFSIPIMSWYGFKYGPGGYNTISPIVNSFVHIWMYLYYGLAAIGPEMQKFLWWKKHITNLQIVQFIFLMGFFVQSRVFPVEGCRVSDFIFYLNVMPAGFFLVLFLNFYLNAYRKKGKRA